jgi:hypothetical protein
MQAIQFQYRGQSIEISKGPKGKFSIFIGGEHRQDVASRKYATTRAMEIITNGLW